MELKKEVLVKVAMILFLLGITATVESHRFDPMNFIREVIPNAGDASYYVKSTTTACCDKCFCTKSIPPICRCVDVKETCHAACNLCICLWTDPPQCSCADQTTFCYPPCNSNSLGAAGAGARD